MPPPLHRPSIALWKINLWFSGIGTFADIDDYVRDGLITPLACRYHRCRTCGKPCKATGEKKLESECCHGKVKVVDVPGG